MAHSEALVRGIQPYRERRRREGGMRNTQAASFLSHNCSRRLDCLPFGFRLRQGARLVNPPFPGGSDPAANFSLPKDVRLAQLWTGWALVQPKAAGRGRESTLGPGRQYVG
jgi:hypothetical protein